MKRHRARSFCPRGAGAPPPGEDMLTSLGLATPRVQVCLQFHGFILQALQPPALALPEDKDGAGWKRQAPEHGFAVW